MVAAPWFAANTVFRRDLPTRAVKEEEGRNNAVFWDVTPCGSCKYRRFGGLILHSYSSKYNVRLSVHSNDALVNLMAQSDNRRL
jgi:hypothetical protein